MFKNAKTIALLTLLSRIFGYIRDLIIASFFGASIYTDMFFIAFKIPNTFRRFLGEGAINSSIIPVLSKLDEKDKPKAIWNLIIWFTIMLAIVTILGVVFSKFLILVFAPGYLNNQFVLMDKLVKFIFPYIFFIGLTVLFMGILNTYRHFAIPAFAPTLLNISLITAVFLLFKRFTFPIYSLCIGVLVGGILQLLISLIDFSRLKLPIRVGIKMEPSTVEIFKLMGLAAIGSSIIQISSIADSFVASFLKSGSFSYIFYSNRLFQLPFAVFSIALAQGSLPDLSEMDSVGLGSATTIMTRAVVFYSLIVVMYFLFFSREIVALLFGHGKFTSMDVINVSNTLKIMMLGFLFFSLTKIYSNVFYSQKDAKTPLKATAIASIFAIIFSFVLGFRYGFLGLAAAYSISGVINFIVIFFFLKRWLLKPSINDFFDHIIVIFTFALGLVSYLLYFVRYGFLIAACFYGLALVYGYRHYSLKNRAASFRSS